MLTSSGSNRTIDSTGFVSGAHNAKALLLFSNFRDKVVHRHTPAHLESHPARKSRVEQITMDGNLSRLRTEWPYAIQCRLRRRAKNNACSEISAQLLEHGKRWLQQAVRKRLRLVEYHDASGNTMKFATFRGFVRKQRLKELDVRRHDDRRVPILNGKTLRSARFLIRCFEIVVRVMFEDIGLPENVAQNARGLLDNACERDCDYHALHPMCNCMRQREQSHSKRLSATRRDGQREYARSLNGCIATIVRHCPACLIHQSVRTGLRCKPP